MNKPFRIGILGGMGPEAGVLLQTLIIQETPAEKDQDHLEVFVYTNPHVPDRTQSLKADGGDSYLKAVIDSLKLLEKANVDILAIACNTAHARLPEIQGSITAPILNMVELARQEILAIQGSVGILATDGTVNSGLFSIPGQPQKTQNPMAELQHEVMAVIHEIKKGVKNGSVIERLEKVIFPMQQAGCKKLVLGCTELSICYDPLCERLGPVFIDPLRLTAKKLVALATHNTT